MSMSTPATKAFLAAARISFATPWGMPSRMEPQSLTTMPLYFHSFRSTVSSVNGLKLEGTPLSELNAAMKVAAPAWAAAWKGGR